MGTLRAYSRQHFTYLTPDESQGASPVSDPVWFARHQPLLVQMANTDYGRDLLCIDKHPYPVVEIARHRVKFEKSPGVYMTDFRIGSKWSNVIRHRWTEFKKMASEFYEIEVDGRKMLRPLLRYKEELVAAATTSTFFPDPHTETSTCDGMLMHLHHSSGHTGATTNCSYTHIATALVSDSNNESEGTAAGSNTLWFDTDASSGDAQAYNRPFSWGATSSGWTIAGSGVWLLNTASIGSDSISSAVFSYFTESSGGSSSGYDFSLSLQNDTDGDDKGKLQLMEITPNSNTELQPDDFYDRKSADADQMSDGIIWAVGNFPASGSPAYKDITLNAAGEGNINKSGVTGICGMEGTYEIPLLKGGTTERDRSTSGSKFDEGYYKSAEETGTSEDPKLVVTHAGTFTATASMF